MVEYYSILRYIIMQVVVCVCVYTNPIHVGRWVLTLLQLRAHVMLVTSTYEPYAHYNIIVYQ